MAVRSWGVASVRRWVSVLVALTAVTLLLSGPAASNAAAEAPRNNSLPEISGRPAVGETLVCYAGSWVGSVGSFTFQWLREGAVIVSGESDLYTVTNEDRGTLLSCNVIATNSEGSGQAESRESVEIPGGVAGPPENVEPPAVTGNPAVGEILSCSQGAWKGSPTPTFTYEWLRDGTAIGSATASKYTVTTADQGHSLSCKVTATNSAGSASRISSNSLQVPAPSLPKNETPPEVLGGTSGRAEVGNSLTCFAGSWSGQPTPTYTYQWLRGGVVIESAKASLYTVQSADQGQSVSCRVTAANGVGKPVEAPSKNFVEVPASRPENTVAPEITGEPEVGETLTCHEGKWNGVPSPAFTFQWLREGETIASATSRFYTVVKEDEGKSLSCQVTANNGVEAHATSTGVVIRGGSGTPSKPENTGAPAISGTPEVGKTLTCREGSWNGVPPPTFTFQWLRDGGEIGSAILSTYTVEQADQGHSLSCRVTGANSAGHSAAVSANVAIPAGSEPSNKGLPTVFGRAMVGETLTCSEGTWTGVPAPTYAYQWLEDGTNIPSASANSYVVVSGDRGHSLSCEVTAKNVNGSAKASSNIIAIPGVAPVAETQPQVSVPPTTEVGEPLKCEPGKWGGVPYPTLTYQWLVNGEPIPLETEPIYVIHSADQGRSVSCKVTGVNTQGKESAVSRSLHIPGIKPENFEAPHVAGSPVVGEALKCEPGAWNGKPSPRFTFQWLRDGTVITSEPVRTYTAEAADQGHSLSCAVIATNSEGHATATSNNSVVISAQTRVSLKELPPPVTLPAADPPPRQATVSTAQILASLGVQLTRTQRGARIASLLKAGYYTFRFAAPVAGTLELFWYEVPKGAHVSAKSKPVLVASSTTWFAGAARQTVKLRLTKMGRQLIAHAKSIQLTSKAVFIRSGAVPMTWRKTFVLSR